MMNLNLLMWGLSVALQGVLLVALFTRGIVRIAPLFTILMAFYNVRSLALYAMSSHHPGASTTQVFGVLAAGDTVLQAMVAWQLFSIVIGSRRAAHLPSESSYQGSGRREAPIPLIGRLALFSLFLIAAAGTTYAVVKSLHANPRAPFDRSVLFSAALFLIVFLASITAQVPDLIRRLLHGFAFFSFASLICQIGRAIAGMHRDAVLFNRWSYAEPGAYLAVVVFWIFVLKKETVGARSRAVVSVTVVEADQV